MDEIKDADLWEFFKYNISCLCASCSTVAVILIQERNVRDYGIIEPTDDEAGQDQPSSPAVVVSVPQSEDDMDDRFIHSDAVQVEAAGEVAEYPMRDAENTLKKYSIGGGTDEPIVIDADT